jgi:hypothetical protein
MIVTDGAFSMDGVVANLKEIAALADKYARGRGGEEEMGRGRG